MNFNKYWFGHSLVWLGVLYNSPKSAVAETVLAPTPNPVSQEIEQVSPAPHSSEEYQSFNTDALAEANISPPEVLPLMERFEKNQPSQPNLDTSRQLSGHIFLNNLAAMEVQTGQERQPDRNGEAQADEDPEYPHTSVSSDLEFIADETSPEIEENRQEIDAIETGDPELGRLRLYERELAIEEDSQAESVDDSQATDSSESSDPELGRLRVREREVASEEDVDTVFLLGTLSYFRSDNILLDDFDPVDDQLARAGLSLLATPNLGPQTRLLASVGGDLAFYGELSELNYRNLDFRAEIQQLLFPRTYGVIGWSNRQFFSAEDGDRFLNDHSVRLALSRRDPLSSQLALNSFYQLRLSFADPSDRSRLTNTLGASLDYNLQSDLEVGLNYQLVLTDFTQREREDAYHQVTAQLSYDLSRNSRVSLYGGFSFGRSSASNVDFDSSVIGIVFDTFLPLF